MILPTRKINLPKPKANKRHASARLEQVARASWLNYRQLLAIATEVAGKDIKDIGQLSVAQMEKVQKVIREKGRSYRK